MNFSGEKKQRMILYAGGAGVAVVALGLLIQFAILPVFESQKNLTEKLEEQRGKLKKAKRQLDYVPGLQRNYDDVVGQLVKIRSDNILHPILGSYLVGVSEKVELAAQTVGLKIEDVREVGVLEMPRKDKKLPPSVFKVFAVLVYGQGSFETISRFLAKLEETHPFLSIHDIGIVGQLDNPEIQRLTVRMEFPIEPAAETVKGPGP